MRPSVLLLCLGTASLSACTFGPNYQTPRIALSASFGDPVAIDTQARNADWWHGFNDPILEALVAKASVGNTDLAQARARIDQLRAAAQAAGAALLPNLDATASGSASHQSLEMPIGKVSQALDLPRNSEQYAVGAEASWEIDLFGRLRRGREAARAELDATEASAGAVAVAVSAETADAYLTLRAL